MYARNVYMRVRAEMNDLKHVNLFSDRNLMFAKYAVNTSAFYYGDKVCYFSNLFPRSYDMCARETYDIRHIMMFSLWGKKWGESYPAHLLTMHLE